jgi:hypothetical protein
MTTAFSLFGFIDNNNLSGSIPTEIGILLDLVVLDLEILDLEVSDLFRRYSFFGNADASRIRILTFCPLFSAL